jgi:hypothetical protein
LTNSEHYAKQRHEVRHEDRKKQLPFLGTTNEAKKQRGCEHRIWVSMSCKKGEAPARFHPLGIGIAGFVCTVGHWLWQSQIALGTSSGYTTPESGSATPARACPLSQDRISSGSHAIVVITMIRRFDEAELHELAAKRKQTQAELIRGLVLREIEQDRTGPRPSAEMLEDGRDPGVSAAVSQPTGSD